MSDEHCNYGSTGSLMSTTRIPNPAFAAGSKNCPTRGETEYKNANEQYNKWVATGPHPSSSLTEVWLVPTAEDLYIVAGPRTAPVQFEKKSL
jgi:hypothetical protein